MVPLSGGQAVFPVTFLTAGSRVLVSTTAAGLTTSTSAVIAVNPGVADRLLVLLPGETYAPGRAPFTAGGAPAAPLGGKTALSSPAAQK